MMNRTIKTAIVGAGALVIGVAQAAGEVEAFTRDVQGWQVSGMALAGALVAIAMIGMLVGWAFNWVRGGSLIKPVAAALIAVPALTYIASKFV